MNEGEPKSLSKEQEELAIERAMDYSERIRSYGKDAAKFVKIEDYLARLPKVCHERFLEIVNLDALANTISKKPKD